MKRREFMLASLAAAYIAGCGSESTTPVFPAPSAPLPRFPQPRELRSAGGELALDLHLQWAENTLGERTVRTRTFNGELTGPTMRVFPGDRLRIRLINELDPNADERPADLNIPHHFNTTNLHTHGLHVSPRSPQDNVLVTVEPGGEFTYVLEIPHDHPTGTYWYHPHVHGAASVQLFSGMLGALIVDEPVPRGVSVAEELVLIHEFHVDQDGTVPSFANPAAFLGATTGILAVNGALNPTLVMRSGEVRRLRLVNGGVLSELQVALEGHSLHPVAYDGISLAARETLDELHLSPGNRCDVLIQAGAPGVYAFQALPYDQGIGASRLTTLLTLQVVEETVSENLPEAAGSPLSDIADGEIRRTRQLTFEVAGPAPGFPLAQWSIDGNKFDAQRVDQQMRVGEAEEWTIFNTSAEDHPFHIHTNPFQVMEVNGVAWEQPRWHDTILVPPQGSVRIRHRFQDFEGLTLLHCHILLHECQGMMQLIDLQPPGLSARERRRRRRELARAQRTLEQMQIAQEQMCGPRPIRRLRWGGVS